jgi:Cu2+-exporting ATPase
MFLVQFVLLFSGTNKFGQMVALIESASVSRPGMAFAGRSRGKALFVSGHADHGRIGRLLGAGSTAPAHALDGGGVLLLIVSACPCALSLATPAAILSTAGALAKAGVMLRSLQALQSLAKVDTVDFGKTGTLTNEDFSLQHVTTRRRHRARSRPWRGQLRWRVGLCVRSLVLWGSCRG